VVYAEDIEGEASHPGKDTWVDAYSAGVFHHRDVADVMISVLDIPVLSDGFVCLACADGRGGCVPGGLLAAQPHAIGSSAGERHPGDANDAADQAAPVSICEGGTGLEDFGDPGFLPHAPDRIGDVKALEWSIGVSEFLKLAE